MHDDHTFNPTSSPWPDFSHEKYDQAAAACETHVVLDAAGHRKVRVLLAYDVSQKGSRGRALTTNVPEYGLLAGDKLEPSRGVPDIGEGFDKATAPVETVWWRPSNETKTKHRNPIYDPNLGITVDIQLVDGFDLVKGLGPCQGPS
jgi:hypothetical protein